MIQLPRTAPARDSLATRAGRNADWPPAPHGGEPPGHHPPDTPFSALLDDRQARTAVAEGHRSDRQDAGTARDDTDTALGMSDDGRGPARADRADGDPNGDAQQDDRDAAPKPTSAATALAALLGGVPLPVDANTVVVARLPAAPSAQANAAALAGGLGAGAGATARAIPTGPAVSAAATALPLRPVAGDAKAAVVATDGSAPLLAAGSAGAPAAGAAAMRLADVLKAAARATAADGLGGAAGARADGAPKPAPATVAAAAGGSARAAAPASAHSTPRAASPVVAAAAPAAAPARASAPAEIAAPARGVALDHAVETVRLALRAGAERGVTHARIQLAPRELGGIEIHLRQTADGLVARVVAQHGAAAQLLQDAGSDLRRQLEQHGLNLLRLDIGASGQQGGRAGSRDALADRDEARAGRKRTRAGADRLAPLDGAAASDLTTTLALPNGALVDVLA
jgi:flagellar hook-length control protein FliK